MNCAYLHTLGGALTPPSEGGARRSAGEGHRPGRVSMKLGAVAAFFGKGGASVLGRWGAEPGKGTGAEREGRGASPAGLILLWSSTL